MNELFTEILRRDGLDSIGHLSRCRGSKEEDGQYGWTDIPMSGQQEQHNLALGVGLLETAPFGPETHA